MEQSTSCSLSPSHPITEREREVCEILLNLANLIQKSEAYIGLIPWGKKGKRSAIGLTPPPRHHFPPEKKARAAAGDSSPATPLSFPPSESDEKTLQNSRNKVPKKKTREELLEKIEQLEKTKESLTRELEKVKSYHNERKAYNAVLKAKQEEIKCRAREPISEPSKSLNVETELSQNKTSSQVLFLENTKKLLFQNHQKYQQNFIFHYNQTPTSLPDLNASADEIIYEKYLQPLDHKIQTHGDDDDDRVRAAEARKRRVVRVREKRLNLCLMKTSKC